MPNVSTNLDNLLDQAIDKLPLIRRNVYKFRVRNRKFRQRVLEDLQVRLMDDERATKLLPALGVESFNSSTTIEFDPETLKQFLDLILEYLPKIIELISLLFATILFLCLFSGMGNTAMAQCPDGNCPLRTVVKKVAAPVIAPAKLVVENRAPRISAESVSPIQFAPTVSVPELPGHWGYPSTIDNHLNTTHSQELQELGFDTSSMSRKQMLDVHDYLHERSRAVPTKQQHNYSQAVPRQGLLRRLFR